MNKDVDWTLLARYLSGECPEEKANIDKWIESDPENERLYLMLKTAWETRESPQSAADIDRIWLNVEKKAGIRTAPNLKISKNDSKSDRRLLNLSPKQFRLFRGAAILIIALGLSLLAGKLADILPFKAKNDLITVAVERGRQHELKLSDGSNVLLDAGSSFKYPREFDSEKREVYLEGEAYFDVSSEPGNPFIVYVHDAQIRVLGTKFNIRGWGAEKDVRVVVEEGSVSLKSIESIEGDSVVIGEGQLSILSPSRPPTEPRSVDVSKYLGWMHDEIFFEDTPLLDILAQLERWYDLEFVLPDSSIGSERLSIHIRKKSLDDILDLLSALTGLSYSRHGKIIQFQ